MLPEIVVTSGRRPADVGTFRELQSADSQLRRALVQPLPSTDAVVKVRCYGVGCLTTGNSHRGTVDADEPITSVPLVRSSRLPGTHATGNRGRERLPIPENLGPDHEFI